MKFTLAKHAILFLQGVVLLVGVLYPAALNAQPDTSTQQATFTPTETATPQAIAAKPKIVSTISMQRTWCFGACPIDEVTLSSDGSADYSGRANVPRIGRYRGKIADGTFIDLLSWLEDQNFFAMKAQVGSGNVDAPELIVCVARYGQIPYRVAFRFGGSFHTQKKIENAILKAAETVAWEKDEASSYSGVNGSARRLLTPNERERAKGRIEATKGAEQVLGVDFNSMPYACVLVRPFLETEPSITTWCDDGGGFHLLLPPGKYSLHVLDSSRAWENDNLWDSPLWMAHSQVVTVEAGKMSRAVFLFEDRRRAAIEAATKLKEQ